MHIEREIKVVDRKGAFTTQFLIAIHEDVMIGGRIVYSYTSASFWTKINPETLKLVLQEGRLALKAAQIANGLPPIALLATDAIQ